MEEIEFLLRGPLPEAAIWIDPKVIDSLDSKELSTLLRGWGDLIMHRLLPG